MRDSVAWRKLDNRLAAYHLPPLYPMGMGGRGGGRVIFDVIALALFSPPGIHQGANLAFAVWEVARLGLTAESASSTAYIAVQLIGAGVIGGLVVPRLVKDAAAEGWGLRRGLRDVGGGLLWVLRWQFGLDRNYRPKLWVKIIAGVVGLMALLFIIVPGPSDAGWRHAWAEYHRCLSADERAELADSIVDRVLADQPELSSSRRFMDVAAAARVNNEKAFVDLMMQGREASGVGSLRDKWRYLRLSFDAAGRDC